MDESLRELLYRSFDISLSASEQKTLDQALTESPEIRKEKQMIVRLRTILAITRDKRFQGGMVDRVMTKLSANNDS